MEASNAVVIGVIYIRYQLGRSNKRINQIPLWSQSMKMVINPRSYLDTKADCGYPNEG